MIWMFNSFFNQFTVYHSHKIMITISCWSTQPNRIRQYWSLNNFLLHFTKHARLCPYIKIECNLRSISSRKWQKRSNKKYLMKNGFWVRWLKPSKWQSLFVWKSFWWPNLNRIILREWVCFEEEKTYCSLAWKIKKIGANLTTTFLNNGPKQHGNNSNILQKDHAFKAPPICDALKPPAKLREKKKKLNCSLLAMIRANNNMFIVHHTFCRYASSSGIVQHLYSLVSIFKYNKLAEGSLPRTQYFRTIFCLFDTGTWRQVFSVCKSLALLMAQWITILMNVVIKKPC